VGVGGARRGWKRVNGEGFEVSLDASWQIVELLD